MRNCRCSITTDRRRRRVVAACLLAVSCWLAGCTDLFFVPSRHQFLSTQQLGLESRDVRFPSADGTLLFAWQLPVPSPRGVVCYFHGNAENISSHVLNVSWLPAAGYEVWLTDYRGYGLSAGKPSFPEALDDVRAGLDQCLARGRGLGVPVFALGQSLGAVMVLEVTAKAPYRDALSGVVADSGFSSYRRIARDALSHTWLTQPLKYPLSWLVTGSHAAEDAVRARGDVPLLVIHSPDDVVVPFAHGARIFSAASGPKCFLRTHGPHNAALNPRFPASDSYREAVAAFFAAAATRKPGAPFACAPPTTDTFQ